MTLDNVQSIMCIDFETYYDAKYSLSSKDLSTSLYITDPRFQVIGVGVSVDGDLPTWLTPEQFAAFAAHVDWSVTGVVAHHAHFDALILTHHFNAHPVFWFDTLSMARTVVDADVGGSLAKLATHFNLGTKGKEVANFRGFRREHFSPEQDAAYGAYCCNDVELEWKLFELLLPSLPDRELWLIDTTIKMFCEPTLCLDQPYVAEYDSVIRQRKQDLLTQCGAERGDLMSNEKFAKLLVDRGIEPGTKTSTRTGKESWAFAKSDVFMQQLLASDDEEVAALAEARIGTKSTMAETRARRYLRMAEGSGGYLPVYLKYAGAHTYRWSGGDGTNFQNLNRTGDEFDPASFNTKGALRHAVVAPPGCKLLVYDLAQIEARMLAWFAGQDDLVADFAAGVDVYCKFASMIYKRTISKADKQARFVGKVCILGLGYGMGGTKLGNTLLSGAMGDKVQFDEAVAMDLGVDTESYLRRVKIGSLTGEDAIASIPSLLSHNEKIVHFAVADHIVRQYRKINDRISALWDIMNDVIAFMANGQEEQIGPVRTVKNGLVLPGGLTMRYAGLHYSESSESYTYKGREPWPIKLYGGLFTENVIQALSREVIAEHMISLRKEDYHIATMTHDEVVAVEPTETADVRAKRMLEIFRTVPEWCEGLPLNADGGVADRYGDAK